MWRHRLWHHQHQVRVIVVDDKGLVHPCQCSWWRVLWYLVLGR